jgi:hypothetical protein
VRGFPFAIRFLNRRRLVSRKLLILVALVLVAGFVLSGCAAGNVRFSVDHPAGFWAGLWHGFIIVITFIWGLFDDTVRIYERSNVGHLYDLGFVLGAMISLGGACTRRHRKKEKRVRVVSDLDDKEYEVIASRIESRIKQGIKSWLDETEGTDDWGKVAADIEARIKRELKNWSEE